MGGAGTKSTARLPCLKSQGADCWWQHVQARGHGLPGPLRGRSQPGQAQDWTAHALHKHAHLLATSLTVKRE